MVIQDAKRSRPSSTSVWSTALALSLVSFNAVGSRSQLQAEMVAPEVGDPPPVTWVMQNEPAVLDGEISKIFGEQEVWQDQKNSVDQVQAPAKSDIAWSRVWDFVRGIGLGVGLVAGYRGIKKLLSESKQERVDRYEFLTDTSLTLAKANLHRIQEKSGLLVLDIITADRIALKDLFENATAVKIFQGAAKKCTIEQPLIHAALEHMKLPWTLRAFGHLRFLGIPGPSKIHAWYNRALTEYYSEEAAESLAIKEFYPFRKDREVHYVIPCCDVDTDGSRSIVLRVLPRYQFQQFKSSEFVAKLKQDNPHYLDQIEQLERAYAANKKFMNTATVSSVTPMKPLQHPSSIEPVINLFPWVCVHRVAL